MSWIKDNQFAATLGGVTLVGAAALIFAGIQGSGRYAAAKEAYDETTAQVADAEGLPLYPTKANEQGKKKAVGDYREAVGGLQNSFGKFRPENLPNIPPQEFTNRLQKSKADVVKAFEDKKALVPGAFFLGFEGYTGTLARESATGILDYQLGAATELLTALGKSGPAQLLNVHRPRLPEEDGGAWKAGPDDIARPLSFEITFKGSEKSARDFFSAIAKSDKYYYVIRTLRVSNEKKTPPLGTDAKFDPAPGAEAPSAPEAPPAGGGFALPGDPAPTETAAAPEEAAPAPAPVVDTGRILSQVLGSEDIYVFIRLDVMQFLPAKQLPQP